MTDTTPSLADARKSYERELAYSSDNYWWLQDALTDAADDLIAALEAALTAEQAARARAEGALNAIMHRSGDHLIDSSRQLPNELFVSLMFILDAAVDALHFYPAHEDAQPAPSADAERDGGKGAAG